MALNLGFVQSQSKDSYHFCSSWWKKTRVFFYTHGFVHYEEYVASLRLTNGLKRNMIERNQMALQTQEQIIALTWLHCTLFSSDVQFISV